MQSESYPGTFFPHKCDVSDAEEIKATFGYITSNIGPIFVLINNAAAFAATLLFGKFFFENHFVTV